ncbi:expressed unknown protein [Seminavis robusta]|uniref:Uncharacterized protein n=1 Tax=Seminavis robusta TaxID=568900 RepID=A0A9N8E6K5_9STRA|nr:expressed unknown protein [Seminavis robusta]|eukprot:Sro567_g168060.1 n/a (511) ;mRNA; f:44391-45923
MPPKTKHKVQKQRQQSPTRNITASGKRSLTLLQILVALSLGLALVHTLTLLSHGHALVEQESDAFASRHKKDFLQQRGSKNSLASLTDTTNDRPVLRHLKILVAIASFDFRQVPHLEETLDGYHELCVAGAKQVDVTVHTTVVYPVVWLDLWRTRFPCEKFQLTFSIENKSHRLHLVDLHRHLFYEQLDNYDLFIYTEDDHRISPTTVATYWQETLALQALLNDDYTLYNIGLVRYEYNFPSAIINDKTRHATENVTRVYWEHSWPLAQHKPILPNAASPLTQLNSASTNGQYYIHMTNHHQGMYLATRQHLQTWRDLPNCQFDQPQNRPGYGKNNRQPLLGTQRVWMSSYQLYEKKYCNVQQVLPVDKFGALTIHHVPNKNYRRKKGGQTVLDYGNSSSLPMQVQQGGAPQLITALRLHLAMRQQWPLAPQRPYRGPIQMVDHVTRERTTVLEERLKAWRNYVARGGVLSEADMEQTNLIEWSERLERIQELEHRKQRAQEIKKRQNRG